MKVAIVGTGYVGLVTGISLAVLGHKVICVDSDKDKISLINSSKSPFYEPGVNKYLKKVLNNKNLRATENLAASVPHSDIIILAVGTPTIDQRIDLSFIKKASQQIGGALKKSSKYQVVVVKSTVLPGVSEDVVKPLLEKYSGKKAGPDFGLAMNPEFLREGSALEDALLPDRIIIGSLDVKSGKQLAKLYQNITSPKIFTDIRTAELTKYAANALFATLISYANEIARISENIPHIDVIDVWKGVHLDKRLSPPKGKKLIRPGFLSYIHSGPGFGGSCFPKDVKALASFANGLGIETKLIKSVLDINNTQPQRIILHLKNALGKNLKDRKIAILGMAFKPNTDDTRESPSFPIIEKLISEGANVLAHDPMVQKKHLPQGYLNPSIILTNSLSEALEDADAVIIITPWEEYIKLSPQFFKKLMKNPIVIDSRRIYDKHLFMEAGIIYKGIGL